MGSNMIGKTILTVAILLVVTNIGSAQFKSQAQQENRVSEGLLQQSAPLRFLGWFNPDMFHMSHFIDFSYQMIGGQGISLGTYTNSMTYQFSDNLNARADLSLSYSPYSSLSTFGKKNDLSSFYLSRAQINYKPWDNVLLQLQYRAVPYSPYYYYSPFYNPWYKEN